MRFSETRMDTLLHLLFCHTISKRLNVLTSESIYKPDVSFNPRRQKPTVRRQRRAPNTTAAAGNTRGKNISTVVSTKNTSMPLTRTRTANANIVINTGNTNAKRAPLPRVLSCLVPPAIEKVNPLPPLETLAWMTGPCWRTWKNRGP